VSDGVFLRVLGTCFGKHVLFPYVSVPVPRFRKESPPSFFYRDYKNKKSRKKQNDCSWFHGTPRATRGWTMTMCSLCMRLLGLLNIPSVGATSGAPPVVVRHTDRPRSFCRCILCRWWIPKFGEIWTFPVGQKYGLAGSGAAMGAVDTGRTVQMHNTMTQEQEPHTHHIHNDIHDTYICQTCDSQNVNLSNL